LGDGRKSSFVTKLLYNTNLSPDGRWFEEGVFDTIEGQAPFLLSIATFFPLKE
jgi:hypothetical protein